MSMLYLKALRYCPAICAGCQEQLVELYHFDDSQRRLMSEEGA